MLVAMVKLGGGLRPPSEASPRGSIAPATPALEPAGVRGMISSPWSAVADARVEPRVGQVDQQVDDDEAEGDEEDQRLHHRVVAVSDRVDHEAPDAVQGEDG